MPPPTLRVEQAARLVLGRSPRLGAVRLVAVDGPSGSGKSTFAAELSEYLQTGDRAVELLTTDLLATWDDPFDWWPALEAGVLQPLAAGRPGRLPTIEWSAGVPRRGEIRPVPVPAVLIVEGVSSGRRAVADRLSALIWVDLTDRMERLERAVERDGEWSRPHLLRWQGLEDAHFAQELTRSRADLLVSGNAAPHPETGNETAPVVPQT